MIDENDYYNNLKSGLYINDDKLKEEHREYFEDKIANLLKSNDREWHLLAYTLYPNKKRLAHLMFKHLLLLNEDVKIDVELVTITEKGSCKKSSAYDDNYKKYLRDEKFNDINKYILIVNNGITCINKRFKNNWYYFRVRINLNSNREIKVYRIDGFQPINSTISHEILAIDCNYEKEFTLNLFKDHYYKIIHDYLLQIKKDVNRKQYDNYSNIIN